MQDTKEMINKQIKHYYENSTKMGINTLIELQDKLSWNYYFLAEEYSKNCIEYSDAYVWYKSKFTKTFLENKTKKIQEKLTIAEIQKITDNDTMEEYANRMFLEAQIEWDKMLLKTINTILNSIRQKISHLKQENNFERTK